MRAIKCSGKPNLEALIQLTTEKRAYEFSSATVELLDPQVTTSHITRFMKFRHPCGINVRSKVHNRRTSYSFSAAWSRQNLFTVPQKKNSLLNASAPRKR